jgi:hypothetical protein
MLSANSSIGCRLNNAGSIGSLRMGHKPGNLQAGSEIKRRQGRRALANASMVEWRSDLAVAFLGGTGTADTICNGGLELRCMICFDAPRALRERALWFPENHKHAAPKIRR